jgi:hypothetical protein
MNYTIACQVNPHIVPFMQSDESRYRKDLLSWPERILRRQGKVLAKGMMDFTRERIGAVPQVRRLLDYGYGIIDQRYYGDVNIFAHYNFKHYLYMLQNQNRIYLLNCKKKGRKQHGRRSLPLKCMHVLVKPLNMLYMQLRVLSNRQKSLCLYKCLSLNAHTCFRIKPLNKVSYLGVIFTCLNKQGSISG